MKGKRRDRVGYWKGIRVREDNNRRVERYRIKSGVYGEVRDGKGQGRQILL